MTAQIRDYMVHFIVRIVRMESWHDVIDWAEATASKEQVAWHSTKSVHLEGNKARAHGTLTPLVQPSNRLFLHWVRPRMLN